MYDIINAEITKCFPWFSHQADLIGSDTGLIRHDGTCKSYKNGDPVPYKSLCYNYTRNFVILDAFPEDTNDLLAIHIIRDAMLIGTMYIKTAYQPKDYEPNIDQWFEGAMAIDAHGEQLSVTSVEYACHYGQEMRKVRQAYGSARTKQDALHARKLEDMVTDTWSLPRQEAAKLGEWLSALSIIPQEAAAVKSFRTDFRKAFPVLSECNIEAYHNWHDSTKEERGSISQLLSRMDS